MSTDLKQITDLMGNQTKESIDLVSRAYDFSKEAHQGQNRYSNEPYFNHVFETAKKLAEIGMGPKIISAGFLHDTIEDAPTKEDEIKKEFGEKILGLVQGVSKLGTFKYQGLTRHAESLRKLFVATSKDVRVLLIKLMDRLHNMETLEYVPEHKQRRIALETLDIYAPIANRLGMNHLRRILEDLAFPYVMPEEYKETKELLKQKSKQTLEHLKKVERSLKTELAKNNITDFKMEYRIKGIYSLYKKLQRKGKEIEKIHDISALRIIVPKVNDCYKVLGIIHNNWRPLPGKIKDYIAFPKPNGYQSLHTTIFTGDGGILEVQIRTGEMHKEAIYGIASHISYKEGGRMGYKKNIPWFKNLLFFNTDDKVKRHYSKKDSFFTSADEPTPTWIKDLALETTSEDKGEASVGDFLTQLKSDFFSHRVFVFTPKGDVVDLPIDSSPVDFAYAIHSDIGSHLSSVKINGKMSSINTKLKNGDIVQIITKRDTTPKRKWLDFTKTSIAKSKIKTFLQRQNEDNKK